VCFGQWLASRRFLASPDPLDQVDDPLVHDIGPQGARKSSSKM